MTTRSPFDGRPRKAHTQQNCEAWFYQRRSGIDVYVRTIDTGPTVMCSISRRQILAYADALRTAPRQDGRK